MERKSIEALIVAGAMVLGLSACGMNGATSDNTDNSQSTSTPAVTEPADTGELGPVSTTEPEDTQEPAPTHVSYTITEASEVEGLEALFEEAFQKYNAGTERVTLDTLASEQAYVKDNGSKVFGEGEALPSNLDEVYLAWRNANHPVTPEVIDEGSDEGSSSSSGQSSSTSGGQTSKPSGQTSKLSGQTSKPSGQTSKPSGNTGSTQTSKPSGQTSKPSGNTGSTGQTSKPADQGSSSSTGNKGGSTMTPEEYQEWMKQWGGGTVSADERVDPNDPDYRQWVEDNLNG